MINKKKRKNLKKINFALFKVVIKDIVLESL